MTMETTKNNTFRSPSQNRSGARWTKPDPVPTEQKIWDDEIRRMRKVTDFHAIFNYSDMVQRLPWAAEIRAGIIVIHKKTEELLMIHQKPTTFYSRNVLKTLGMRRGFPKGGRDPADLSALATAARELREETGIDIFDQEIGAMISPTVYYIPRKKLGEIMFYFICAVETKPQVKICEHELVGYEWVSMNIGLRSIQPVTRPTYGLLCDLDSVVFSHLRFMPME